MSKRPISIQHLKTRKEPRHKRQAPPTKGKPMTARNARARPSAAAVDTSCEAVERLAVYAEQLCADTDIAETLRALVAERGALKRPNVNEAPCGAPVQAQGGQE